MALWKCAIVVQRGAGWRSCKGPNHPANTGFVGGRKGWVERREVSEAVFFGYGEVKGVVSVKQNTTSRKLVLNNERQCVLAVCWGCFAGLKAFQTLLKDTLGVRATAVPSTGADEGITRETTSTREGVLHVGWRTTLVTALAGLVGVQFINRIGDFALHEGSSGAVDTTGFTAIETLGDGQGDVVDKEPSTLCHQISRNRGFAVEACDGCCDLEKHSTTLSA